MRMTEKEREEGGETWRNLIFIAPGDFSCLQVCFCLSVSFSISIMLFLSMLQYLPELNIACLLSSVSPSSSNEERKYRIHRKLGLFPVTYNLKVILHCSGRHYSSQNMLLDH